MSPPPLPFLDNPSVEQSSGEDKDLDDRRIMQVTIPSTICVSCRRTKKLSHLAFQGITLSQTRGRVLKLDFTSISFVG